ncbi:LysM peptidoglycan-binding domain-containing protein [Enterobacter hormaechei subsp. oharae]|nr:LysM peptidoglycan-binding domain-containing protein [Enterobacter hormaechei]MCC9371167.1 LysM peptidoglycan-binding domain-containing protein [Enterobacter hormaechei subsp. oharae]MCC9411413.1 LysM peptidoglycan-binding domain-containing protein [Enterobacter hormaechei subsp. oharae]SAI55984.1 membrane-bound lytic murein transglycosylase D [Enterobacter hormaechei]
MMISYQELVRTFLNKSKVMESYTSDQSEYWDWLYLLHHDGAYSLGKYLNGTREKSADGKKWALYINKHLSVVEGLLKNTEVNTKFKLSTGNDTAYKNKNYIAAISPFPSLTCPNLVSDYEKALVFIKGVTDANGMTESVNAIAGSEIVFTILADNYKELAKAPVEKNNNGTHKTLTYTVKKGDTLSAIAKKYSVSVEKLARINKIHNVNMLRIGAKLKIPDSNQNHGYVSRYVSEQTKKEILKSVGVENANTKAAIEYSRGHIVLPKGSKSADSEKKNNVIHIKTTTTDNSVASRSKNEPEKHQTTSEGKTKNVSVDKNFEPVVDFSKDIPLSLRNLVTNYSLEIIKGIMKSSGVHKITITSTLRSVEKQVNAMYVNMQSKGIDSQLAYYAKAGREVIKAAIDAGGNDRSKTAAVKAAMTEKVIQLQSEGRLVSRHCVSELMYAERNVFDISKNLSSKRSVLLAFDKALTEYAANNDGFKYISPFLHSGEPAFHVEIVQ